MKYSLVIFSFISVFIAFSVFLTFKGQYNITYPEFASKEVNTLDDFNKQFTFFPNITTSSIPIDALRASFAFNEKRFSLANSLLSKSINVNPYIGYPEVIKAEAFYALGNIDSSLIFAEKAFLKWPKSLKNYTMYLKALAFKGDTTAIQLAYNSISSVFKDRKPYSKEFVNFYSKAKLKYLITNYEDKRNVKINSLYGSWIKSYDFDGGKVKLDSSKILTFNKDYMESTDKTKYNYKITKDTLFIYSFYDNRLITKNIIQYSDEYSTLLLSSDPRSKVVNQFFKKIK